MRFFLHKLFVGKDVDTYVAFIGQSIMQRARPRGLLCPLQLGLGVQMKGMFQSSFSIDELSAAGFSISNTIVQIYEKCSNSDLSIQYMADNFDHNVETLDGRNTMHGMAMMLTVTPFIKHKTIIPRVKVSKSEIENAGISEFFLVDHHAACVPWFTPREVILMYLPRLIDMEPTNISCIYSTLKV